MVPAFALGLMVTVNVTGVPAHPPNAGVTVTVAVNGLKLLLVAVNALIFPVPLMPKPTFTELFQLKVTEAPAGLLKEIAAPGVLLQ